MPNPYFRGLGDNFLGKNCNNSWKIGPNFFLQHIKNKICNIQFCEICGYQKLFDKIFFHPCLLLLFLNPGYEIRDLGSGMGKNQDPG